MPKRSRTSHDNVDQGGSSTAPGIVNLDDARARLRSRLGANSSHESLANELQAARLLIDKGLSTEAETRLTTIIRFARHDAQLLAQARCALSMALEMQGQYRESLEAVLMYESMEGRVRLDEEVATQLRVQTGIAYNYTGDHPKAIALLNATLRDATEQGSDAQMGTVYAALARIYRSIHEYPIARDYAGKALGHYRNTGDWRGLAEAYFGIALADTYEGDYESALENYEQALKLVGDQPAPFLLGKIYANMAGACWFLKRPQDGIKFLEKATDYYERTEHKANAALGYNNLGINLMLTGDWKRAQEVLERAIALASELEHGVHKSGVFDSMGQLHLLRGDLKEAEEYLEQAVTLATEDNHKWYTAQALRNLGRCHLAMNRLEKAREEGHQVLALAEQIGDRQAICESRLLLAELHLRDNDLEACAAELQLVTDETEDTAHDLAVAGDAQRLHGKLALAQDDATLAVHHYGRSVSIFEMLGDRYRCAVAYYGLGRAYASAQPERAEEHLTHAVQTFRELGAHLDLARAEEALAELDRSAPEQRNEPSALTQLLTLRLAEAVASRELLLRELAAVVHQEASARRILIVEPVADGRHEVVVSHGYDEGEEAALLAEELGQLKTDKEREQFGLERNATIIPLRSTNATPALLFIAPRTTAMLLNGVSLQPLLRVVELGMDVCALRERERAGRGGQEQTAHTDQSLMPGFIHSSPAMTRLVEEVHKIRSSDVTVLVTGESGTGKELVARAIHAISSRRSKIFVPFNCTAVPKELSEGYLFGYRRGAYTGAVNDSAGVIRTAAGGTLFLDEVGDLPLDVQPKLLRFLQEGEIQPLGEQRPIQVDVRIIAATNTDLETMVAEGRFREDLYYRLNVIRLRVPPLRERRSEIPTIVNYYINHYSAKFTRRDIQITPQTLDLLMVCDWPGNVRQLCNEVQRIVARAEDGMLITPEHLSPELKRTSAPITSPPSASVTSIGGGVATPAGQNLTLADAMAELERRMIAEAMRKHCGNISRAARELGLTRRGLYLKLERHDLSASA
ncbi:MAG: sigma 54-interacting transcriptional regulator [Pyrinomonadaceae bacterium]